MLFVPRNVDGFAERVVAAGRRAALRGRAARGRARRAALGAVGARTARAAAPRTTSARTRCNPEALEEQLGGLDFIEPVGDGRRSSGFADPDALLGAMRSERQEPLLEELQRFVVVLEGYTDVVVETLGERMVSVARAHRRSAAPAPARTRRGGRVRRPAARPRARTRPLRSGRRVLPRRHRTQRRRSTAQPALGGRDDGADPSELAAPGLWLARIDLPTRR